MLATKHQGLIKAVGPNLYRKNPFRLAELAVEASPKEIKKRGQIIKLALENELPVPVGSAKALPLGNLPDISIISEALLKLDAPEERLVAEFFWFWPDQAGESSRDEALKALGSGAVSQAKELWLAQIGSGEANPIAAHNLAVLAHCQALDLEHYAKERALTSSEQTELAGYWKEAYNYWASLLDAPVFWNRLKARLVEIDDPRLTLDIANQVKDTLGVAVLLINVTLAIEAIEKGETFFTNLHLQLVRESKFGQEEIKEAGYIGTRSIQDQIKNLTSTSYERSIDNPATANKEVTELLDKTGPLLKIINWIFATSDAVGIAVFDDVALTGRRCLIQYVNKFEDWKTGYEVLSRLKQVARSESARSTIDADLQSCLQNYRAKQAATLAVRQQQLRLQDRIPVKAGAYSSSQSSSSRSFELCQSCSLPKALTKVSFSYNIGMLFSRRERTTAGTFCFNCSDKYFWRYTFINLVFGWWGLISFFMTLLFLLKNIFYYGKVINKAGLTFGNSIRLSLWLSLVGGWIIAIIFIAASSNTSTNTRVITAQKPPTPVVAAIPSTERSDNAPISNPTQAAAATPVPTIMKALPATPVPTIMKAPPPTPIPTPRRIPPTATIVPEQRLYDLPPSYQFGILYANAAAYDQPAGYIVKYYQADSIVNWIAGKGDCQWFETSERLFIHERDIESFYESYAAAAAAIDGTGPRYELTDEFRSRTSCLAS